MPGRLRTLGKALLVGQFEFWLGALGGRFPNEGRKNARQNVAENAMAPMIAPSVNAS